VIVDETGVRVLLKLQALEVPEGDLPEIALRLSTWLSALEEIEAELGDAMDEVDPIPPVYPRQEV
jgi:hypothetical protein